MTGKKDGLNPGAPQPPQRINKKQLHKAGGSIVEFLGGDGVILVDTPDKLVVRGKGEHSNKIFQSHHGGHGDEPRGHFHMQQRIEKNGKVKHKDLTKDHRNYYKDA